MLQHANLYQPAAVVLLTVSMSVCPLFGQDKSSSERAGRTDSVAVDLFQFAPDSAASAIERALLLQGLERFTEARTLLRSVVDASLSGSELLALRNELGPDKFIALAAEARLLPESRLLLAQVNIALESQASASDHIPGLIEQLGTPGIARQQATAALLQAGNAAVPELLAVDPASAPGAFIDHLLASSVDRFRSGLLAGLEGADPERAARIVGYLSSSSDSTVAESLLRLRWAESTSNEVRSAAAKAIEKLNPALARLNSASDAAQFLAGRALHLLQATAKRFDPNPDGFAVGDSVSTGTAGDSLTKARRQIHDATALAPDDPAIAAVAALAAAAGSDESNVEPNATITGISSEILDQALKLALQIDHARAGRKLLHETLERTSTGRMPANDRTIQAALLSPDAMIRIQAAAWAASHWPEATRRSEVTNILSAARSGSLRPEAVVAGFDDDQARSLHALLEDAGYTVAVSPNAITGFDLASQQLQCELFVVSTESAHWPIATTLANLRADCRTRRTTVLTIGPPHRQSRIRELDRLYGGVRFLPGPVLSETRQSLSAQESRLPENVQLAIARRNAQWTATMQSLNLPPLILTGTDRRQAQEFALRTLR